MQPKAGSLYCTLFTDTGKYVLQLPPFRRMVMYIVGGYHRDTQPIPQLGQSVKFLMVVEAVRKACSKVEPISQSFFIFLKCLNKAGFEIEIFSKLKRGHRNKFQALRMGVNVFLVQMTFTFFRSQVPLGQ